MNDKDPYESLACNCVDVGTLISDEDTHLTLEIRGNEATSAQEQLHQLEQEALSVGSGNCKIKSETTRENGITVIRAMLDFDCTAEKLIFEMAQR